MKETIDQNSKKAFLKDTKIQQEKRIDPLITTIIPTYKRPELLKRAIKSVLNQTYPHLQICIYDNCSGDETKDVVENLAKIDKRVKYFCHDTNIGSLKNFAYGFSKVDTPYFSFLSDDDFLFPDFYETAINKLKEFPQAAFFGGKCVFIDQKDSIKEVRFNEKIDKLISINEAVENYVGKDLIPWTSILFKTERVQNFKLETSIKLHDVDFLYNIMYHHPIYVSSKLCAVFSSLPSCSSFNYKLEDVLPYVDFILPKLKPNVYINNETHQRALERLGEIALSSLFSIAKFAILNKDFLVLEKIKIILKNKFQANGHLKKINLYKKISKYPLLWHPALFMWRSYKVFFSFVFGGKNYPLYKERRIILHKVIDLMKKLS